MKKLILVVAILIAPLTVHYGDQTTQNEGWTIVGVGGYETRGTVGWFVCDGQC